MSITRHVLAATTLTAMALCPARFTMAAGEAVSSDLPIKTITLYRSGVGSFERRGTVTGDKTVQLRFETEQVNDILKSMVLLDLDGGKIAGVSYGSKEPLERRLKSFGVDISNAPDVASLLQSLRGSAVRIQTGDGPDEGTILGVESRPIVERSDKNTDVITAMFVNLVTKKGIRSIPIPKIIAFELTDEHLNSELQQALAALAEHRADRLKSVDLRFTSGNDNNKDRRVVVAYVMEMPVWKASYRLVLPEAAKDGKDTGKPMLQGWAIVENTTDDDWRDVRLSLASGRPVSFTMDLYEPIFAQRPMVPVPVLGGILPRIYETARRQLAPAEAPSASSMVSNQMAKESMRFRGDLSMGRDESTGRGGAPASMTLEDSDSVRVNLGDAAAQSQASAGEAGEQFIFTLDAPVTIERQRSAMLPILGTQITGRRVSIYNASDNPKSPMRGVQLKNDSGLHLMPGPIAVYDANTYAGDAQIPHTSRNQDRLLSYALDIDVNASTDTKQSSTVVKLQITGGLIRQTMREERSTSYHFDNFDSTRGRTILVEHPKTPGWDIIEPKKTTETADTVRRFDVPLDPSKSADLTVKEEMIQYSTLAVTSIDLPTILSYFKQGRASQAVVDAVKKAAEMQTKINDLNAQLARLKSERNDISKDQSRIRENMSRIDRNSELYGRYVAKLNEQESRLEQIISQLDDTQKKQTDAEGALRGYLNNLEVE
ncbi:MAG TPA: hypothetical protein VG797_01835 [Phycisphaerales bacterium]|nr:hypothetical protein [Phycisphaerales bacterium]